MYNRNHRQTPQRYNTSGQFVSAGHLGQSESPARNTRSANNYQGNNQQYNQAPYNRKSQYDSQETRTSNDRGGQQQQQPQQQQSQQQQQPQQQQPQQQQPPQQQPPQQQPQQQQYTVAQQLEAQEEQVPPLPKEETMENDNEQAIEESDGGDDTPKKPYWMKPKGIKKISNKERRRRQNEQLRRLLTPKNALMVLNEMLPGEQVNNQFVVEPTFNQPNQAQFFQAGKFAQQFCADLNLEGVQYKGYGENKVMARNNAAEQAIRDLVIKRMAKALTASPIQPQDVPTNQAPNGEGTEGEEQTLPMIQLASYALHRLFVEWQAEGFKVPVLNKVRESDTSSVGGDSDIQITPPLPKEPKPKKLKELPADAAQMHPCMLLSYMRAGLEYHDIGTEGDKPQNMLFTMGINVDGATYIGKASNKKEARKKAAASACKALFNIDFV